MTDHRQHRTHGNGPTSAFADACAAIRDPTLQRRAEAFLAAYARDGRYRIAMERARLRATDLQRARNLSPAFAKAQDDLVRAVREYAVRSVEDALVTSAVGDVPIKKTVERPSTRAAALVLPAHDPHYRRDRAAPLPAVFDSLAASGGGSH